MTAINPLLMLLEEQAAHIDVLEGQVQALEQALRLDSTANVQSAFDVSDTLAQVLIMLSDGKPRSKEALHSGLYYRRPEIDEPAVKILDTIASKLRKSVKRYGIVIETIWSGGLQIITGREVVLAAMERPDVTEQLAREEDARQRKRERDRLWRKRLRAAQKLKDRPAYLQESISRLQPWKDAGISRPTWYRRREKILSTADNDDRPVSHQANDSQAAA